MKANERITIGWALQLRLDPDGLPLDGACTTPEQWRARILRELRELRDQGSTPEARAAAIEQLQRLDRRRKKA